MEQIFITRFENQPIICKVTQMQLFFLEGEMLYPFAGVEFDYFKENDCSAPKEVYLDPKPVINGLYRVYNSVIQNKARVLSDAAPLQQPVRSMSASLLREKNRFEFAVKTLDALQIDAEDLHYLSKRAATRLTESITNLIGSGDLDFIKSPVGNYESVLERIIKEYDFVKDIDTGRILKKTIFWAEHFQSDADYGHIRFKTIRTPYPQFEMPKHLYGAVSEDEFLTHREGFMPFFIGSQFGLIPRFSEEKLRQLEGQKIVVLGKSQLSGVIAGLGIYEVRNGNRIQIAYFRNEKVTKHKEVG